MAKPRHPFKPFDYIFYRVADYQDRRWQDSSAWLSGVILVCGLQSMLYIAFFVIPLSFMTDKDNKAAELIVLLLGLSLAANNLIRYGMIFTLEEARQAWADEPKSLKKRRTWIIGIGILFAFAMMYVMPGWILPSILR